MTAVAGTGGLVRLVLRRDRVRLPVWVGAVLGLVYASASAVQNLYDDAAERALYAATIGASPASVAFSGPPVALDTLGGITVFEVSQSSVVATALLAIFLVVRHTRGEEELGRTELLRAAPVGRFAPAAAALLVVGSACLVVGIAIAGMLLVLGLPAPGSLLFGASTAAVGLVFAGVAACAAQVTEHARGALGLAGVVLGVSFVLRAAGDVGGSWLVWLSPIGWAQAVHAYGEDRWWPLLLSAGLLAGMLAMSVGLLVHRDFGSGLVRPRPGPATAGRRLGTAAGLALRLQRAALLGWTTALFLGGLTVGSVGGDVRELVETNEQLREALALAGGVDIVDAFIGTVLQVLALIATGFTVSSVLRLRAEESLGRAELLLSTGLFRRRWALGGLVVTTGGTAALLTAGGLGVGVAHAAVTGDPAQVPRLAGLALAYLPAALILAAVAVLLVGWLPRAVLAAWAGLALCFVVGWLGGLLDIPDVVSDASPFTHVPRVPAAALTAPPLIALTAGGLVLGAVGLAGLRRRDLG